MNTVQAISQIKNILDNVDTNQEHDNILKLRSQNYILEESLDATLRIMLENIKRIRENIDDFDKSSLDIKKYVYESIFDELNYMLENISNWSSHLQNMVNLKRIEYFGDNNEERECDEK